MAAKKGGLGQGLDALFNTNSAEELSSSGKVTLKITDIEPNRNQPRKVFDEAALTELSESIAQNGILQPLLVRPMADGSYQIVAGERRWRAARKAGLTEVPVYIRALSDEEVAAMTLVENLQRQDLNPIEEAQGISRLMEEYGYTQEQTAQRIGKSRSAVANAIRLLALPADVLEYVRDGLISAGHARALLSLENEDLIRHMANEVIAKGYSVREAERLVKKLTKRVEIPEEKPTTKRDSFFDEVELSLSAATGRKVKVKGDEKGGSLEIEFYSLEDLKGLAALFDE